MARLRSFGDILGQAESALRQLLIGTVICGMLPCPRLAAGQASNPSNTQWLVDTAREVLIAGVKLGLDEAGTRLLGPAAWRAFSQVLSPVVEQLRQQFPALSLGRPGNKGAADAGRDAAEYLAHSAELQRLLVANYERLAKGQNEILLGVRRLERLQKNDSKNIQEILQMVIEIEKEIQTTKPSTELPTWIDLSDYEKEAEVLQQERAGKLFTRLFIRHDLEDVFASMVADEGKTDKVYKCRIQYDTANAWPASGKYRDQNGQLCRKMVIDVSLYRWYLLGQPDQRERRTAKFCETDGTWQQKIVLKKEPYSVDLQRR